ncbi:MAG: CheR family methyltransferase [Sulfurimonas sp.]|nr:CheR family methyltransferase [Sulfurimonas sp.]
MSNNKEPKAASTKISKKLHTDEKSDNYFIVGIGASAGGLSALESFFSGMPADNFINMAFVIVQHLDPNHKSFLTEIIQRYTSMKVYEIEDAMQAQLNCVYIIPPKYGLRMSHRVLYLVEATSERKQYLPIDLFFHSLANDQLSHAIGVILSGTGHDGTEGIKAIKEAGGLVVVQSIESCEYDGMPSSAIATAIVDDILAPNEMPRQLMNYLSGTFKSNAIARPITHDDTLKKIFILLESQTNHDFSMYKQSTMLRRIERRLAVNNMNDIVKYYQYLQENKNEVQLLFADLLIGVTSFFRDKEVFLSLEKNAIPKLFSEKSSSDSIRIWIPGCSTGEEAYSIAILIAEYMQKIKQFFTVQIFATDIDASAIATARAGIYPLGIATNISQARLKHYFIKNSDNYIIHKNIRDMLVFSLHDVVKDPPFSRLDLISCRNLLIYMNVELQQKLIFNFHYALNMDGVLLLGSSETLGELTNLYTVLDSQSKLFQCKKNFDSTRRRMINQFTSMSQFYKSTELAHKLIPSVKLPLGELIENAILEQIAPAAALVNDQGNILYLYGEMDMYLKLPSGDINKSNILKMAREGLVTDLTIAFHKAKINKQIVRVYGLKVKKNNHFTITNLTIRAVTFDSSLNSEQSLYLILLEQDLCIEKKQLVENVSSTIDQTLSNEKLQIKELKKELQLQKEFLQDANNQLEISNEELKSYNEEIQSIIEEFQSTNEELETSKEELQSVNEELSTVNSELNMKVMDLSRSNNDINNLLSGTGIGTFFVDHRLRILRFTPAVTRIINLILSDIGRSVEDIASKIVGYNSLAADIQTVLDTLVNKALEVTTIDDKTYMMKIQPYRTLENVIEGAVVSFIDITEMRNTREELKKANKLSRLATVVRDSSDAITVEELNGKIIAWNPGAQKLYGWSEDEALNMHAKERIPLELYEKEANKIRELSASTVLEAYKTKRLCKDGAIVEVHIISSALKDNDDNIYAIATTERLLKKAKE